MMSSGIDYKVEQIGIFKIDYEPTGCLEAGDVGYIIAGIKTVSDVRVGDTITNADNPAAEPPTVRFYRKAYVSIPVLMN